MSILNYGTYENQLNLLNDSTYNYLLEDDIYLNQQSTNKVVKDAYLRQGDSWSPIKQIYTYSSGEWKLTYKRAYRFYIEISSTTENFDLRQFLTSTRSGMERVWDGNIPIKGILKITSSGIIGSNNADSQSAALQIDNLPYGSSIIIINEGSIYGMGGAGGNGSFRGSVGNVGGNCIRVTDRIPNVGGNPPNIEGYLAPKVYLQNTGRLWAGGGGGGGGSENNLGYNEPFPGGFTRYGQGGGGGGGGQGYTTSSGGLGSSPARNYGNAGQNGGSGGFNAPGNGGPGGSGNAGTSPERDPGGTGGRGGAWGQKGQTAPAGVDGSDDSSQFAPQGGVGGEGGYVITGNSTITLLSASPTITNGYVNTDNYKGRLSL